ncbi:uncharacterized protein HKW66_Vig0142220 [Vigna angularis]|uniref:PB1-like domain-containing protein n=1 Tax=Phaseolus angularis TaxID=3914 RepID=A0A8T0KF58_PHAAN|nr:uncharacterized protein HKW66_Vig0142220 [Vigna angularis]
MVVSLVKGLKYVGFKELWYYVGGDFVLEDKFEPFCDDTDVMHMVNLTRLNGQVHVFMVHTMSEPQVRVKHRLRCLTVKKMLLWHKRGVIVMVMLKVRLI